MSRRGYPESPRTPSASSRRRALLLQKDDASDDIPFTRDDDAKSESTTPASPTLDHIRVMVRVRPLLDKEMGTEESVSSVGAQGVRVTKGHFSTEYSFDRVFDRAATQADLYEVAKGSIEAFLQGYNATIFAYGQTGTGKTYTMLGLTDFESDSHSLIEDQGLRSLPEEQAAKRGIIPRAVEHITDWLKNAPSNVRCKLLCSYLEIYNEKIYDLLSQTPTKHQQGLEIREDKVKGVHVMDAKEVEVKSPRDIYSVMLEGMKNRAVAQTEMNERSSRSHAIFQMVMEQEHLPSLQNNEQEEGSSVSEIPRGGTTRTRSKLNLVDLAGSEKWRTHGFAMDSERISEMTAINQSLSTLGNCIAALMERGRSHIPFRNSRLTRLLQDSLGGNTKTTFVATVSPSVSAYEETCSTLKFADRANRVQIHARVNEIVDPEIQLRKCEREIQRLKDALSRQDPGARLFEEENLKLKEQVQRLEMRLYQEREQRERLIHMFSSGEGEGSESGRRQSVVLQEEALLKRVQDLEDLEREAKTRQQELEEYHQWLYGIEVNYDSAGEASLAVQEKLVLLEQSIAAQAADLQRAKRLFLRDIQSAQGELHEKYAQLKEAEQREQMLKAKLDELEFERQGRASEEEQSVFKDSGNKDTVFKDTLSHALAEPIVALGSELESCVSAFRPNFASMLGDHLSSSLDSFTEQVSLKTDEEEGEALKTHSLISQEAREGLVSEVRDIVDGCCEALAESLVLKCREGCESIVTSLRHTLLSSQKQSQSENNQQSVFKDSGVSKDTAFKDTFSEKGVQCDEEIEKENSSALAANNDSLLLHEEEITIALQVLDDERSRIKKFEGDVQGWLSSLRDSLVRFLDDFATFRDSVPTQDTLTRGLSVLYEDYVLDAITLLSQHVESASDNLSCVASLRPLEPPAPRPTTPTPSEPTAAKQQQQQRPLSSTTRERQITRSPSATSRGVSGGSTTPRGGGGGPRPITPGKQRASIGGASATVPPQQRSQSANRRPTRHSAPPPPPPPPPPPASSRSRSKSRERQVVPPAPSNLGNSSATRARSKSREKEKIPRPTTPTQLTTTAARERLLSNLRSMSSNLAARDENDRDSPSFDAYGGTPSAATSSPRARALSETGGGSRPATSTGNKMLESLGASLRQLELLKLKSKDVDLLSSSTAMATSRTVGQSSASGEFLPRTSTSGSLQREGSMSRIGSLPPPGAFSNRY